MNWHVIPNWLTGGLTIGFYIFALIAGYTSTQIIDHSLTGIGALVVLLALGKHSVGAYGGGAVKLLAVAFLWYGFWDGLMFLAVSTALLVVGVAVIWLRKTDQDHLPYLPYTMATAVLMADWPKLLATVTA
jgi:Flp pilus assembly protein protease CpaA